MKEVIEESANDGIVSSNIAGTKCSVPFPDAINAKKTCEHPDAGMGVAVGESEKSKSSFHLSFSEKLMAQICVLVIICAIVIFILFYLWCMEDFLTD